MATEVGQDALAIDLSKRGAWERKTAIPLIIGAFLFLIAYGWPIVDPALPRWADALCFAVNIVVWVGFAVDYLVRLGLDDNRWRFVRRNWIDAVILVLPMLRPLRALRSVLALSVIARRGGALSRGRIVIYVAGAAAILGLISALAVLQAEREAPGANIVNFGDALWWAASTLSTVGYGDHYPITAEGRLIAVGLMISGLAVLGMVTAALASWFIQQIREVEFTEKETEATVDELMKEIQELRQEFRASSRLEKS